MTKSKPKQAVVLPNTLTALDQRLGPIEYRHIDKLKLHASNPRKHPERQLVKLATSIAEFGFAMPVLVDGENTIIAGEARITAARRLGVKEVPVIIAHHWSAAQVRAYRLADNRLAELATWDVEALSIELAAIIEFDEMPIELLGWEMGEIDLMLDVAEEPSAKDPQDEQIEVPAMATARTGDLWLLGKHRMFCGSSLEAESWETLLSGETAAMVFTDPPYNVPVSGHVCGLGKVSHNEFAMASGEMSKGEFVTFLTQFMSGMMPHLKDGAILDICMDWRHLGELLAAIESTKLSLIDMCVWSKTSGAMGSLYCSKYELVLIAKKGTAPHTNNVDPGKRGRNRTNVWDYAGVNTFGKGRVADLADHPTVKPVALVADAIRDVTKAGEIVLDAFVGSGTTILAAERTKRRAYGIEIAPQSVDVAIRRWQTMTGEPAVLATTGENYDRVKAVRMHEAECTVQDAEPAKAN